jgi:hypothetical protein
VIANAVDDAKRGVMRAPEKIAEAPSGSDSTPGIR